MTQNLSPYPVLDVPSYAAREAALERASTRPTLYRRRSHVSAGAVVRLGIGLLMTLAFVVLQAVVPIFSIALLPVFFGCVSFMSGALQDMGHKV